MNAIELGTRIYQVARAFNYVTELREQVLNCTNGEYLIAMNCLCGYDDNSPVLHNTCYTPNNIAYTRVSTEEDRNVLLSYNMNSNRSKFKFRDNELVLNDLTIPTDKNIEETEFQLSLILPYEGVRCAYIFSVLSKLNSPSVRVSLSNMEKFLSVCDSSFFEYLDKQL